MLINYSFDSIIEFIKYPTVLFINQAVQLGYLTCVY